MSSELLAELQRLAGGEPPSKPSVVFVNRTEEMRILLNDVGRVREAGTGMARLIVGDAGMGKSTLIYYLEELISEKYPDIIFSHVELRRMVDVRPSELGRSLYGAVIENMRDQEGRSGRELLTYVALKLTEQLMGFGDKLRLRLRRGSFSKELRYRLGKLGGCRHTAYALALMIFDELNSVAYDYLLGLRRLEPAEARRMELRLRERMPWGLREEWFSVSLLAIIRALSHIGFGAVVIAIDELEVLYERRRDVIRRFLPMLTAILNIWLYCPCYFVLTSTPTFWEADDERSVRALYPFLYQRLNGSKLGPLKDLTRRDVEDLVSRIIRIYREVYGEAALPGIEPLALAARVHSQAGGNPRNVVTHTIRELESAIIR